MLSPVVARSLRAVARSSKLHSAQWRRSFSSSLRAQATYGFIGLGQMGYPMAANLRSKLHPTDTLVIQDVNKAATENFLKEHGGSNKVEVAKTARELAEKSETIICSLPEPSHVKSVFSTILEFPLEASKQARLFIDCSTIDPLTSTTIANQISATSAGLFVDAPMSGGVMGSKAGTLTFMLGAPSNQPEFLKRAEKTLLMMGKRVIHMGPQGAGLAGKLANNYLLAISNIATAEAMNLGLKLGLQPETLAELINSSSGKCWSSEINNPVPGINPNAPASKDYLGGFGLGLMRKDLRLAIEAAKAADAKLVLGDEATKIYRDAEKSEGVKDFSVIYRWLGGKSKPNV